MLRNHRFAHALCLIANTLHAPPETFPTSVCNSLSRPGITRSLFGFPPRRRTDERNDGNYNKLAFETFNGGRAGKQAFVMSVKGGKADEDSPTPSPTRSLKGFKVTELKEMCRARGLKVSGRKEELVARLEDGGLGPQGGQDNLNAQPKPTRQRARPSMELEERLIGDGYMHIAGVDEVGRGPLAGPVVTAAVVLGGEWGKEGSPGVLDDSKKLSESTREHVYELLINDPNVSWAVDFASLQEIETLNILHASERSMARAVDKLARGADFVLVDGARVPAEIKVPCSAVVKGDSKSASIAAASIIAKVTRDRLMRQEHQRYPHYNFADNKGYGTKEHMAALAQHGACPIHRRDFAPVRAALEKRNL